MSLTVPCDPAAAGAQTAFAAALARTRRRFSRTAAFVLALCLGVALLLWAIEGRGFGTKLIYSMCIGGACLTITEGTRLAAAALVDRVRAALGLQPSPSGFDRGWRGIAPAALAATLGGPTFGLWLGDRITGHQSASLFNLDQSNSRFTIVMSVLGTLISVFVLSTMERLASARAQAEAAQRQAAENQLRLLQSQLEPHMLFNTLANLRVLIGLDPARAQAMLDRLIAFLRATLAASRTDAHTLATEFARLADYLALMEVRMGPRLAVDLDLPAALAAVAVPPLLLQPLVENAIQHGLEPKVAGGRIAIGAHREAQALVLTVRDTGVGLAAAGAVGDGIGIGSTAGSGFGLEQVRGRLATLYGDRAALTLAAATDAEGGTLATVRLPLP
jgi:hypothetical protein